MKVFNRYHAEHILVLVSRSSSVGLPLICRAARSPAFLTSGIWKILGYFSLSMSPFSNWSTMV